MMYITILRDLPAVNHGLVDGMWTTWWRGKPVARVHLYNNLHIA